MLNELWLRSLGRAKRNPGTYLELGFTFLTRKTT